MKCIEYKAHFRCCEKCDIKNNIQCDKVFNFEEPKKYVVINRRDMMRCSWNACPTCGATIAGFKPKDIDDYRCPKCNQRISW